MIILKPIILQKAVSTVIAPHGITDLIHANQHNITSELLQINGFTLVYSHVLHFTDQNVLATLFLLSSIIHFRHDMPRVFGIPRFIWSSLLISLFSAYNIAFFPFMVLLHVPNHYRINWRFIKKNLTRNIQFLFLFTIFSSFLGDYIFDNLLTGYVVDMAKGIVIAHIIYEELHIHKDLPLLSIGNKTMDD
tara:strand:- start:2828 stop:3400 length:573 start_codon:yes stop_codon:yes gene_type:complete